MQQTFLFIDESWLGPLLILWVAVGVIVLAGIAWKKGLNDEFWSALPVWIFGAAIIYWVVPAVMVEDPRDGEGRALAIRGYGFFLLIGVVSGVALAMHRARQLGLHPDVTLNLCFVLFISGIAGARFFYVFEYWDQFQVDGRISVSKIVNMTEGGLVVYGGIIGGALGGMVYLGIKNLAILPMLDILAPCMMIGLAIGRIGCLMNGCCWGGICDSSFSIRFPEGVPPYARQVETGELFGMKSPAIQGDNWADAREILEVAPNSAAARQGVNPGDRIVNFEYEPNPSDKKLPDRIVYLLETSQGRRQVVFSQEQIPEFSLPVHPTQIYSSINAFLIFLFLWFYFPSRTRDGQVIALLMILYPIGRFLLELIRSDEMGQFGTTLTPSQWVSVPTLLGGIVLLLFGYYRLKRSESFSGEKSGSNTG